MVSRIVLFLVFPCLVLALLLTFAGIQRIEFGDQYYVFLNNLSHAYDNWKLEIPDVPSIPTIPESDFDKSGLILAVLIKIGNFFVFIFNGLIAGLNITISIVNIVIKIIQFTITFIVNIKGFVDGLRTSVVIAL